MWYSLENGKDYCLDRTQTLEKAKKKAVENPNITEIFEYDNNDELVGCVWSRKE